MPWTVSEVLLTARRRSKTIFYCRSGALCCCCRSRARSYRRRSCLTDAAIVEVPDIDAPVIFAVVEEPIAIVAIDVDDEAIAATEPATKTHEATATKKENANLKSQEKAATAEVEVSDDEGTGTGASIRWTKDEKEELLNLLSDGTKNYQYWKTQQKKCAENISIKVFRGKRTVSSIINQWKTLKDSYVAARKKRWIGGLSRDGTGRSTTNACFDERDV